MSNKLYIVIDVQNDFVSGSLGSPWAVATTEKIAQFLESVKDNPETVGIWATRDTHCDENTKDPFFGINVSEFEVYEKTLEGQKLPVRHCIMDTKGWEIVPSVAKFVKADKIYNKPTFMSEWLGRMVVSHARANAVNLSQSIDEIVLMGSGWGHGVGLCQIGAAVMASKGYTYKEILNHYYPESVIEQHEQQ